MIQLLKKSNIRFMKFKYLALGFTGIVVLAGLLNVLFWKGFKLGVDFGGGTLIRVIFKDPVKIEDIRQQLKVVGLGNSVIQESGKGGREVMIRTMQVVKTADSQQEIETHQKLGQNVVASLKGNDGQAELQRGLSDLNALDLSRIGQLLSQGGLSAQEADDNAKKVVEQRKNLGIFSNYSDIKQDGNDAVKPEALKILQEKTFLGKMIVVNFETVGPQAGADLRKKATLACVWALIGMLVYIALRFKIEYGVAAIFTLTQDVLVTLAIFSFTNREINLPIIAALLTIVGFSINDTIVIFDRVRENQKMMRKETLENIMNLSINQCLGRTIITTGTVFLTVLALFLFGGQVINDFAFTMLIGSIEGVYSTIYLSCPAVLIWHRIFPKTKGFRK